jgi:uncharacterized protein
MNISYKQAVVVLLVLVVSVTAALAVVPPLPAMPSHHVVDLAGIITNDVENSLNNYLRELEQKTTAQVVVLTIKSLEGESLEDFSITTAHDRWKIGQKGKDNGALLVVSLQDRKYRFEIGYGLEGILPDSLVGTIGRTYLVPFFRQGKYSQGIQAATLAVINEIATSEGVQITGLPQMQRHRQLPAKERGGIARTIISLILFIGAIILFITNPRLFLLLLFASSMGGGRRGWGGGGGFSGGGGGFSGGGGGFGGGGASGGW